MRHRAVSRKVAVPIPGGVIGISLLTSSFRQCYGPRFDSASNTNEYQVYFLGSKAGRFIGLAKGKR